MVELRKILDDKNFSRDFIKKWFGIHKKLILSQSNNNIQTYKANMKITQEISEASGIVYEVQNYGEVRNDNILIIFGDEMTYNDLREE